jgi:hypothetical protein
MARGHERFNQLDVIQYSDEGGQAFHRTRSYWKASEELVAQRHLAVGPRFKPEDDGEGGHLKTTTKLKKRSFN